MKLVDPSTEHRLVEPREVDEGGQRKGIIDHIVHEVEQCLGAVHDVVGRLRTVLSRNAEDALLTTLDAPEPLDAPANLDPQLLTEQGLHMILHQVVSKTDGRVPIGLPHLAHLVAVVGVSLLELVPSIADCADAVRDKLANDVEEGINHVLVLLLILNTIMLTQHVDVEREVNTDVGHLVVLHHVVLHHVVLHLKLLRGVLLLVVIDNVRPTGSHCNN